MPMLGMAQDTGKLIAWRKAPGDAVAAGEVLFEVETDKSVSEVEAPRDGFLSHVQAAEGTDVSRRASDRRDHRQSGGRPDPGRDPSARTSGCANRDIRSGRSAAASRPP